MGKKVTTPETEAFILENAFRMSSNDIATCLSISKTTVRRVYAENDISIPKELSHMWKGQKLKNKTTFTIEEDQIIKDNYLSLPVKRIGNLIGRSFTGITGRLKQLGLEIPEELKEQRKASGMFVKGQVPSNKGKKMSPEIYERCKHTFFQKGNVPHNAKEDWQEVKRRQSSGCFYYMIKIPNKRRLIFKHVWIWENENGTVKEGFNIVFKNGNSLDCRIENLECISNAELMSRNMLHNFPEDLKQIIQLKGALNRQINKIEKK